MQGFNRFSNVGKDPAGVRAGSAKRWEGKDWKWFYQPSGRAEKGDVVKKGIRRGRGSSAETGLPRATVCRVKARTRRSTNKVPAYRGSGGGSVTGGRREVL